MTCCLLIQTLLCGLGVKAWHLTDLELEVAEVVGGDGDGYFDLLKIANLLNFVSKYI